MEKLFEALQSSGQYTKSFSDFQSQFGSPEGQEKLYGALKESGSYTKSIEDFTSQFFNTPAPVKTNDSASADPAVESNQNDTGSKSEDGSSESYLDIGLGLIGAFVDGVEEGIVRTDALPNALTVYNEGANMSKEDYAELAANTRAMENTAPDKDALKFRANFEKIAEEQGWWYAFAKAAATPEGLNQLAKSASSSGISQLRTVLPEFLGGVDLDAEDTAVIAGTTAVGAGVGYGINKLGDKLIKSGRGGWKGKALGLGLKAIGAGTGAFSGLSGGTSRTMEKGFTTVELLNEAATEMYGDKFKNGTDAERVKMYQDIVNNKDVFEEIQSRSIARGNTIGFVDGVTGLITMGAGKGLFNLASGSKLSKISGLVGGVGAGAIETAGGGIGEYLGQKAAGQEIDPFEIGMEMAGDKIFTITQIPSLAKKPSYSINGEKMNGSKFAETLKIMNDDAYVKADIKIDNSPLASEVVNSRRKNIATDQKVDSRINGVADRAEAIRLTRDLTSLEGNKTGNATKINQTKARLQEISDIYKNSEVDATIKQRQEAVAEAVESKFETEFNKNYKAIKEQQAVLGIEPVLFEDTNSYLDAIESKFGKESRIEAEKSSGVFAGKGEVFINKQKARESINVATGNIGNISVTSHEVLHPIFNALIGGAKTQGQFVNQFKKQMTSKQKAYVKQRLKNNYESNPGAEAIELMNIFSDGIIKNEINYDQTTFEKLGSLITDLFRSAIGLTTDEISFKDGRSVFNFLKEYNTSIKDGELSDTAIKAIKEAESKKGVKVAEAKVLSKKQFSMSVAEAEAALQEAEDADPNDPSYLDNLEAAEDALDAAEKEAANPTIKEEVKEKPKPKPKVERPVKPTRTTDLGPRDPLSKKIMDTYDVGMYGIERTEYKASKPLPAPVERKLIPMFEGYINTIVQQKFKQFAAEALEFQDALSILRTEVSSAIRTYNPAKNKDLAGYVKKIVQTRQSLMFKDANAEFAASLDDAKGVTATEDTKSIDRSGTVERRQATFNELDVVDDTLIKDISQELEKEIRVRVQKGTLSETVGIKKGRETYIVSWLENYVNKQLFKKLSKKLGAIGERNGETVIPGAYIDFLNDPKTFDIITKALPIKSIKKSYGKLFPIEKVGRELTAEGNPVFRIKAIEKRDFLTYFVKGKKSALLERQKQLFREILEPVAKQVVANYATPENLMDLKSIQELAPAESMDAVERISLEAKLANLESELDRYKGEEKGFDIIQFSIDENASQNDKTVTEDLLSIAGLKAENTLLKDSSQGKQKFYIDKLEEYYKTREEFMKFLPKSITRFRGLTAGMLGFVYREDGSYYDFYRYDYKKIINKEGETVTDKKALNELFRRGKAAFRNKLYDTEGNTKKYSETTNRLLKETNVLIKEARLGGKTPNLHSERIKTAKAKLKPKVKETTAQEVLEYLSKNNELNAKIAELYISLFRDFVNTSKDEAKAKRAVVNMLLATNNTVNGWRSLASISSIIYDKNNVVDYYFEHNDSMRSVLPRVLTQILRDIPISYNVDSSLIPSSLAKLKNKTKETKEGNAEITENFYKDEISKNKDYEQVTLQQSKDESNLQFSKDLNTDFNKIIQDVTGINSRDKVLGARARIQGEKKGRFDFFIPPSAEDFQGLLYKLKGKGKVGEQQEAWFKKALFDPFAKGIRDFESYKQNATSIVNNLKKSLKDVPAGLNKVNSTGYTNEVAARVILWAKNGYAIPDLSKQERSDLIKIVQNDPALLAFVKQMDAALNGYPEPQNDWLAGTLTTDAINMINTEKRAEFLKDWQANVDVIFSKENINKLEAAFGKNYKEALLDMLYRMETGRNRPSGQNKQTNQFMNWVNDSVGTIMFFNTRSALLQLLSTVNFINWNDNNPVLAAKAFANQDQFWKDFSMLFNSDFLKQRRSGLKNDVNADDIANAAATATNKTRAALSSILKAGFLPTQMADSFAIAMGGASFIRNRTNTYINEGMSKKAAEEKAFLDFQEIAEETQQSSRPDRVSQQQASPLGRIILAFANTPMQYMRLTKKAVLDLKNGRGSVKANITKIAYYTFVQNVIFSGLQAALFASLFEEEDEETIDNKQLRVANSMLDSVLRGTGVYGAIVSTLKNIALEVDKQRKKSRPDYTQASLKALSISPPVDSKIRKLLSVGRAFTYKNVREKMGSGKLDDPALYAFGETVSALLNIPLDRAIRKANNVEAILNNDTKYWQKVALLLGWSKWDLGLIEKSSSKKTKSWGGMKRGSWKK